MTETGRDLVLTPIAAPVRQVGEQMGQIAGLELIHELPVAWAAPRRSSPRPCEFPGLRPLRPL